MARRRRRRRWVFFVERQGRGKGCGSDSGDSNGTNDGDIHNGDTNEANTISRDKLLKERQKHKIFSMDEILAMHAETDFGEDVATFLDGSGLVKNTGPAARTKFVRMMKVLRTN